MAENNSRPKLELVLSAMAVSVIGISILSMFTTLILVFFNVENLPVILAQLPLIGLPIGFLLVIALLIASIIRRRKEASES